MKTLNHLLFLLLFGVTLSAVASAQDSIQKVTEVEGVSEYRLDNGCRVLLYPDASAKVVTVNMTVLVGSRHEGYGETGMAHLLEHMLFKGTPKHPDIDRELKERGALDMNGTTWYDRTNYFETLPASDDNTEWAIEMEADRMVNCFIRAEDLLSEMTVVRSEFEMSENNPSQILNQRVMANAFEWHNYGKSVIGNKADIERVPIPSLRAFYKKYYRPENVVLVVTGKFDTAKTLGYAQKHFGAIENPKTKLPKTYTTEPTQDGERVVYLRRVGGVPTVATGYHVPATAHPDYAVVQVLAWILGDEPSGRLYKNLIKTKKANSVSAFVGESFDPGVLYCEATFDGGEAEASAFGNTFASLIETTAVDGIDAADVERAKADLGKDKEDTILNSQSFAMSLSEWSAYGDWRLFFIDRDRIAQVTVEDVKRVAERYLRKSNRTLGFYLPTKEPQRTMVAETPNVKDLVANYTGSAAAVATAESFDPTPANIDSRLVKGKLDSGMGYQFVPKQTRGERFQLRMTLNYGNPGTFNSRGMISAAETLGDVMTLGTTSKNLEALDDLQAKLKTQISVSSQSLGQVSVSVEGRKKHFAETMDLLKDILRNPSFPTEEFETMKSENVSYYEQSKNDPGMIAQMGVSRALAPVDKTHIDYVPTIPEMIEEMETTNLDCVRKMHGLLGGDSGSVTITGAFDQSTAIAKLGEITNGWKSNTSFERILSQPYSVEAAVNTVETPDQASSMYFSGANVDARSKDKDWEALMLAADIIGGGSLDSRLADWVREKNGLSYQVGCQFAAGDFDRAGAFMVYATTNPANKDALAKAIDKVFAEVASEGLRADEIEAAKSTYIESVEASLGDDDSMIGIIHRYEKLGQDMAFLQARLDRVKALTVDEVNAAAKKLCGLKRVTILAGDFANAKEADKKKAGGGEMGADTKAIKEAIKSLSQSIDDKDIEEAFPMMTEGGKDSMLMDTVMMAKGIAADAKEMGMPKIGKKLEGVLEKFGLADIEMPEDYEEEVMKQFTATLKSTIKGEPSAFIAGVRNSLGREFGSMNELAGVVEGIEVNGDTAVVHIVGDMGGGPSTSVHGFTKVNGQWLHDGVDQEASMALMMAGVGSIGEEIEISGKTYGGEQFDVKDLRGKVVLVDFWGTWCGPCVAELPRVKKLHAALKDKNFTVLGIAADQKSDLKRFFSDEGELPWTNIIDGRGAISDEIGVAAFPTTLIIDANGVHVATPMETDDAVEEIAKLLKLSDEELKALQAELSE